VIETPNKDNKAKSPDLMKTTVYTLVMIAISGSGISCYKEIPDSDSDIKNVEESVQSDVFLEQEKRGTQSAVSEPNDQGNSVSNAEGGKVKPKKMEISRSARVFLWQAGAKKEIGRAEPWVINLQRDCETLFLSADDILKEAVTKWTLQRTRADNAIELLYEEKQHFKVRVAPTKSMHVDGLLIPLKPLHGNTAVIYHRLGSYSAGPLINTAGKQMIDQLTETLKNHGLLDN